jgi:LPPG:FO 2-phospho-L-lactate transferase
MSVTVLAGGVGGSKLVEGIAAVVGQPALAIIANPGDDTERHGLVISPDPDILTYHLAGLIDREKGWGMADESFRCLEALGRLGEETWFGLGDLDLATHIVRTQLLREGRRPTEVAAHIAERLGVQARILLPSDAPIRTWFRRADGWVGFQEHYIRDRCEPEVLEVDHRGAAEAAAAPEALAAITGCDAVIIAPSNPIASIGPILAVAGIRAALSEVKVPRVAVSPLPGGKSLKGPTDRMMRSLGLRADAVGVADVYEGLIDGMLVDEVDAPLVGELSARGLKVALGPTVMRTAADKERCARAALDLALA